MLFSGIWPEILPNPKHLLGCHILHNKQAEDFQALEPRNTATYLLSWPIPDKRFGASSTTAISYEDDKPNCRQRCRLLHD